MAANNFLKRLIKLRYSSFHEGKTIVHFVGGRITKDLLGNLDEMANWVLDNDITILWGDDYQEKYNKNHPVAALIKRVKQKAEERGVEANTPIRILQLGEEYNAVKQAAEYATTSLETEIELGADVEEVIKDENPSKRNLVPVYDESEKLIGYYDDAVQDEVTIYTHQQQDRQRAYYNNADALFVLPGGPGCAYEITNAFIYMNSGDLSKHFPIYIIDNDDESYKDYIKAYLKLTGNNPDCKKILMSNYHESASDFVDKEVYNQESDTKTSI